jgi:DNA-binding MarR family transcriptional regulator
MRENAARPASAARRANGADFPRDAEPVKYGPLAHWIGFHLRMAQTAAFQAFAREVQDEGLRPGRFATLTLIGENPGISQTALSRANGRDKSTLTPVLTDLVRRGLVHRKRMARDRRAYRLTLTPAGERMLLRLNECAKRHERNLDRVIGARDRTMFLRTLRKIETELG